MSSNFPTMKKRVIPSSVPLGISHKNPMKRTAIRKNKNKKNAKKDSIFNKVVSYLISDSYMYNPSVFPRPSLDCPPPKQIFDSPGIEEDVALQMKGSNKKWVEKVVDFLEADCYLYSPLISDDNVCSRDHAAIKTSGEGGHMRKSHGFRRWRLEQTTTCKTSG